MAINEGRPLAPQAGRPLAPRAVYLPADFTKLLAQNIGHFFARGGKATGPRQILSPVAIRPGLGDNARCRPLTSSRGRSMAASFVLAIDQGTTSSRAIVYDAQG